MTDQDSSQFELDELRRRWLESPTPQLSIQLAEHYRRRDRRDQAVEILEEVLQKNPEHLGVRVALGRYRIEMAEPEQASREFEIVVAKDPIHLVANKLLVGLHLDMGRERQARDRLDLYTLLNASDPEIELLERRLSGSSAEPMSAEPSSAGEAPVPDDPDVGGEDIFALGEVPPPPAFPPTEPTRRTESDLYSQSADRSDPFPELFAGLEDSTIWSVAGADPVFELGPPRRAVSTTGTVEDFAPATPEGPQSDTDVPFVPAVAPTATLGHLYLEQGHLDEAESAFLEILESRPGSTEALRGLATVRSRREGWLTAHELLAEEVAPELQTSPQERKSRMLTRYLARLRSGAERT